MCRYEKRRGNSRDNRKIPSHWAEDKCDASGRDALMSLIFSFIEKSFLFQFVVFSVGLCTKSYFLLIFVCGSVSIVHVKAGMRISALIVASVWSGVRSGIFL